MKKHSSKDSRKNAKHGATARVAVNHSGAHTKRARRRRRGKAKSVASPSSADLTGGPGASTPSTDSPAENRCAIYVRSASKDSNVAEQLEECARFVAQRFSSGWRVDRVYVDRGYSGLTLDRPDLNRMTRDAKSKPRRFSTVVVSRLDRFARDMEIGTQVLELLLRRGVRVYSVNEGEVSTEQTTAARSFALQCKAATEAVERKLRMERARAKTRT